MTLVDALAVITTMSVVLGVTLGVAELRRGRQDRSREAQMILANSHFTPEFVRAMATILKLPDGLSRDDIMERLDGDPANDLAYWSAAMETIGMLVFNRAVPLAYVDQAFAGPIIVSWRKLTGYVDAERSRIGRDAQFEWFEWLAAQLVTFEATSDRQPAQRQHRDWRP